MYFFWRSLYCLSIDLRFRITPLASWSFGHYVVWSLTYAFWLPFGILKVLTITLFDLWLTLSDLDSFDHYIVWSLTYAFDYHLVFWKFWPLHCLIINLRFRITLWYLESFDHYIVWSLTYACWLPFGVLKVLTITLFDLWLMLADYPLVSWKFWPLHCLIFDLRFLIALWYLESFDH